MPSIVGISSSIQKLNSIFAGDSVTKVPPYQRGFAWGNDQITRLWRDVLETADEPAKERTLFLASLVFHEEKDERFLVDGQQRLATLSLMLGVVRHNLKALKTVTTASGVLVGKIEDLLFVDGDESHGVRLELGNRDKNHFLAFLKKGKSPNAPGGLRRAWNLLNELFLESKGSKDIVDFSKEVHAVVRDVISFSVVTVSPPFNPFSVFEALNSTGLDLAQSDLIKNRVLQVAEPADRESLNERWENFVRELPEGEVTPFLRAWWTAREKFVSQKKLYLAVKDKVEDSATAEEYVEYWTDAAKQYAWICHGAGTGLPPKVNHALAEFADMGFKQGRPIVLGFLLGAGHKQLPEAIEELGRIYVRVLKSAQQRGSIFEDRIDEICRATQKSPIAGLKKLREIGNELISPLAEMDWRNLVVDDMAFARYLLVKISENLEGPAWAAPDTATIEIEHILPQSRPPGFTSPVTDKEYKRLVSHVGNLTLILRADQPKCSNFLFDKKRAVYETYRPGRSHPLKMTYELVATPGVIWDKPQIEARGTGLSETGKKVWPRLVPT